MPARIEDYGLIGNCETAALVSRDGSIDWLCLPCFDSPACFAALLGTKDNGHWRIAPSDSSARISRRYRDDTLILETTFETAAGAATVIDFMPKIDGRCDLVRLVVGKRGRMDFHTEVVIRFDYGVSVPWVQELPGREILQAVAGPDGVLLRSPTPLLGEDLRTFGDFSVEAGETAPFVLSYGLSHRPRPEPIDPLQELEETEIFWRGWSSRCSSCGPWTGAVRRSMLTLKALSFEETGAIVAAPTTSLPEQIGGLRNWDYRYCWLRDAAFTLLAFMKLGYYGEARAWRDWLLRAVAGSPEQIQILYGVMGAKQLPERELPWLSGYEASRPVRVGNAAVDQQQLDVYGEVVNTIAEGILGGMPTTKHSLDVARIILEHLEAIWREPDEGIWEVRGPRRQFTHSKVMAWVAFDRAATLATRSGNTAAAERWRRNADEIHAEVCRKAFDAELNAFVQFYGSRLLDASLLLIPLVGFLPATDARVRGTLAAIERKLVLESGFVLRYESESGVDGLPPGEGVFLACSFWLVENYILQNRLDEARALFSRLLGLRNDLGLLSEEYDPVAGRMLGNFPQAFSHIGLINSALRFMEASKVDH
jgi:GH15 family glucan-1,4-alpha-glucosidase